MVNFIRKLSFLNIRVPRYYKKSDLPVKYANSLKYISENEVFLTDHKDFTNVECINGPCAIISFEEYEALSGITNNTFYSRLFFIRFIRKNGFFII